MDLDKIIFIVLTIVLTVHALKFLPSDFDLIILITASAIATFQVVYGAFEELKERRISIALLASIALIFSLLAKEYTSAVFINLMLVSARILGSYTEGRARRAIEGLLKLKPEKATIKQNGKIKKIAVSKIKFGDLVVVELGERIPIDGRIMEGSAAIDQSSLTGESLPVDKKAGDMALSSTMVVSGNLLIKTEKIGKETAFEKIIELVEQAAAHKPKITALTDKFTTWYVLLMFAGSAILYVATSNLILVLAVVLVVSADDIAVAIPLAFLASIGHAAKRGVIIKGGDFLEGLNKAKILVVDKTGTLTYGKLKVEDFFIFENCPAAQDLAEREKVLALAGSASILSTHPSAKAILKYAEEKNAKLSEPEKFEEYSGKGSISIINNKKVSTGKISFFEELDIKITDHQRRDIAKEKDKGLNTTLLGYEKELIGFFTLADEMRPNIKNILSDLKNLGIEKIIMLTGDNEKIAGRIAEAVGIINYHANLLPEDKLKYLKKYLSNDYKTIAIGDGVNDAALLNAADIGVAMGGIGADITVESGDIVLMQDDLSKMPEIMRLAKYTNKVVRQDFMIWAVTNGVGLYLVFSGAIPAIILPTFAAAYNFATDFIPILNSARLFNLHIVKIKNP